MKMVDGIVDAQNSSQRAKTKTTSRSTNDHLKHDMYDGPNENEKRDEETKRIESTDSETTPFVYCRGDCRSDR